MERLPRPFRLCTTSFIYPDHILPNVRQIGHLFDEMELLIFESRPLPSRAEVNELALLGQDLNLTYNIHLPVDVSLTAGSAAERRLAADTLKQVLERLAPLNPTTHTLHLDMELSDPDGIRAWEQRACHGLDLLFPCLAQPEQLCIETLWYDPSHLAAMVRDYGFSVCADLGHHFKYGYDPGKTFDLFRGRIPLVHLHGVDLGRIPPKDHTGLDLLPSSLFHDAVQVLASFTGTLSIEVFGLESLKASLLRLEEAFTGLPEFPRD